MKMKTWMTVGLLLTLAAGAGAQWMPTPNDTLQSVRIQPDFSVAFSVYAPKAAAVLLGGSDIPGLGRGAAMKREENGVWRVQTKPLRPGSYRYEFKIDGVSVIDPRNPLTSESNMNTWSLIHVEGEPFMDLKDVPRGAVSELKYHSQSLKRFRRMHVYTPPGYESGTGQFPVLYLLHGALDSDNSWSTVGRAGIILDNLIAEGKAVPMIVVMPAGHTGPFKFGQPMKPVDEFVVDFNADILPLVESRYRVMKDREHRAIAGLSMGGWHTLNIVIPHLEQFAYAGVFSSGIFGLAGSIGRQNEGPSWEDQYKAYLSDADLKSGLRQFWFATGSQDFLLETSRATVALFKKYGFDVSYRESGGGHDWINWRDYLHEFLPLLFK